ncbi:hypothetical protein BH10CYA1_BH10CYA1_15790 [soil metagenome]
MAQINRFLRKIFEIIDAHKKNSKACQEVCIGQPYRDLGTNLCAEYGKPLDRLANLLRRFLDKLHIVRNGPCSVHLE